MKFDITEKEYISERQAAILIGVMPKTLLNWRAKNKIIPVEIYTEKQYFQTKKVSYDKQALLEWYKSFNLSH